MDGSGAVRCRVGVRVLRAVRLRAPPQQTFAAVVVRPSGPMWFSSGDGGLERLGGLWLLRRLQ